MIRSMINHKKFDILEHFFQSNSFRQNVSEKYPVLFSQLTREFFYRNCAIDERLNLMTRTFLTMENRFTEKALQQIYFGNGIRLWSEDYEQQTLAIDLIFRSTETREGLMTLGLRLDDKYIYHVNCWFDTDSNDDLLLYIGALQGSRDGLSINRALTKHFYGYRPKNLIMYALRILAQCLSVQKIYAVSNYGFYTNSHLLRIDRKLKTSLNEFWQEDGGDLCQDRRFYSLPIVETRKSIEGVVSHKRNLYRKRFAAIDALAAGMNTALTAYLKLYSVDRL